MRQVDIWKRFWWKVDPCRTDGCWIWTGTKTNAGYGQLFVDRTDGRWNYMYAHHFLNGVPLRGLHTDHVRERGCSNKDCVNPDHLEIVSPGENIRRGNAGENMRSKTHCPKGHPYDEENTYQYRGRRTCRACHKAWQKRVNDRRYSKQRASVP